VAGNGPRVECGFVKKVMKKKAKAKAAPSTSTTKKKASKTPSASAKSGSAKGKRKALSSDEESGDEEDFADQMNDISDGSSAEGGENGENWSFTMGGPKRANESRNPPPKRIRSARNSTNTQGKVSTSRPTDKRDPDIIVLSDD